MTAPTNRGEERSQRARAVGGGVKLPMSAEDRIMLNQISENLRHVQLTTGAPQTALRSAPGSEFQTNDAACEASRNGTEYCTGLALGGLGVDKLKALRQIHIGIRDFHIDSQLPSASQVTVCHHPNNRTDSTGLVNECASAVSGYGYMVPAAYVSKGARHGNSSTESSPEVGPLSTDCNLLRHVIVNSQADEDQVRQYFPLCSGSNVERVREKVELLAAMGSRRNHVNPKMSHPAQGAINDRPASAISGTRRMAADIRQTSCVPTILPNNVEAFLVYNNRSGAVSVASHHLCSNQTPTSLSFNGPPKHDSNHSSFVYHNAGSLSFADTLLLPGQDAASSPSYHRALGSLEMHDPQQSYLMRTHNKNSVTASVDGVDDCSSSLSSHSASLASTNSSALFGSELTDGSSSCAALRTQIISQRVQSTEVERPILQRATQPAAPRLHTSQQQFSPYATDRRAASFTDKQVLQVQQQQKEAHSSFENQFTAFGESDIPIYGKSDHSDLSYTETDYNCASYRDNVLAYRNNDCRYLPAMYRTDDKINGLFVQPADSSQVPLDNSIHASRLTSRSQDWPLQAFQRYTTVSTIGSPLNTTHTLTQTCSSRYVDRPTLPVQSAVSCSNTELNTAQLFSSPDRNMYADGPMITPAPANYNHPFIVQRDLTPPQHLSTLINSSTRPVTESLVPVSPPQQEINCNSNKRPPPPPYPGPRRQQATSPPSSSSYIQSNDYKPTNQTTTSRSSSSPRGYTDSHRLNVDYRYVNNLMSCPVNDTQIDAGTTAACQLRLLDVGLERAKESAERGRSIYQTDIVETDDDDISSQPYDTIITSRDNNSSSSLGQDLARGVVEEAETTERELLESPKPERRGGGGGMEAGMGGISGETSLIKHFSNAAYRFYMEQHVENVLKSYKQRQDRRMQLEKELNQVNLPQTLQDQIRKMLYKKESNYLRLKRAKLDQHMFERIRTLGSGAFGKVDLVRKKDTNVLYALKMLGKKDVLRRNQVAHVKAERDILAEADNEWVVKLYYSFQDTKKLYIVMDYIPGGDMMGLLIKLGIFEEHLAQFYIAELVLAIESVHRMGFIHRDIKPDNILIDKDGHIKLSDFGLCTGFRWTHNSKYYHSSMPGHQLQESMELAFDDEEDGASVGGGGQGGGREVKLERNQHQQRSLAHSLVGTPNYIAPEVLCRSGYTRCCDWWSVGVILYEMRVGQPPFHADTPAETQRKVIDWRTTLRIPADSCLSTDTSSLILALCCDANNRLGKHGAEQVKGHAYFANINFSALRQQPAPYIPPLRHATDTSNFDPPPMGDASLCQSDCGLMSDSINSLLREGGGGEGRLEGGRHAFLEFTFRRFFDDDGRAVAQRMHDPETNDPIYV